jgi:rubredoxin
LKKFKCSICGYTYDEAAGIPEKGIAPGTKWEDIPQDFVCPWCGAPKSAFEETKESGITAATTTITDITDAATEVSTGSVTPAVHEEEHFESLRELSAGELSALCSNLAKGCEKQRLMEETDMFFQLADYYKSITASQSGETFDDVARLLKTDLSESYSKANAVSAEIADRGALRALVWSEKVSKMAGSLMGRYAKEGDAMLENTKIYVCDICGFIYAGNNLPEICPVCKVPNYKISQVGRR